MTSPSPNDGRPRRAALALGVLALPTAMMPGAILMLACAAYQPDMDAGRMMDDAALSEGVIIRPDSGMESDAPAFDARGMACEGTCNPTRPGSCLDGTCVLAGAAPSCGPSTGALALGASCESTDACAPGLACFRAGRTASGVCSAICCPTATDACAADPRARCGGDGVLVDGTETAWGRCILPRSCDVLAPELACEAREGCYIVDGEGHAECRISGSAMAEEPCTVPEDCAAGLFCGGLGARTCLRICGIDDPRGCDDGERCVAQSYSPTGSGICVASTTVR